MSITEGGIQKGTLNGFNRIINCYNGYVKIGYFKNGHPFGKYQYFDNNAAVIAQGIFEGEGNILKNETIKDFKKNDNPSKYASTVTKAEINENMKTFH